MGRAFKTPRRSDLEQWAKVEALWMAGFRFPSQEHWGTGVAPYTDRLREVEDFVRRNPDHPFRLKP